MVNRIVRTTATVALFALCNNNDAQNTAHGFSPGPNTRLKGPELPNISSRSQVPQRMLSFAEDSEDDEPKGIMAAINKKIGTVDEDRIIFPELASGEVPRMFSSLQYSKSEQGTTRAQHAAGSTLGAAALVAGTTIGAGILALPTATAASGFLPSSAALCLAWAYMCMSGLLLAELSLNRIAETGKTGQGILSLYESSLGKPWSLVGSGAYFFLHYAVMVAYIAQGGTNLDAILTSVGLEGPCSGQVLFAGTTALALYLAKSSVVEKFNNVLVVAVVASFLGIVGIGASTADLHALIDPVNQHPEMVVGALPILFLSLVYQNVVPTVVTQLEGDRQKITTAIVGGTLVPLVMFLAWNAVILGNVMSGGGDMEGIDPVALLQSGSHGGPLLGTLVTGFSELALVTSLIGFVYGLLDALTDVTKLPSKGKKDFEQWKPALFAAVFLPPLALSFHPGVFYQALDSAGAFGVSTLFLVLPPIMVWKARYGEEQSDLATKPMVPLGKIPLGSMWKAAGTLILEQGAEKLGIFDMIQDHLPNL